MDITAALAEIDRLTAENTALRAELDALRSRLAPAPGLDLTALAVAWADDRARLAIVAAAQAGDVDARAQVAALIRCDKIAKRVAQEMARLNYGTSYRSAGATGAWIVIGPQRGRVRLTPEIKINWDEMTVRGPLRETMRQALIDHRDAAAKEIA